MRRRSILCRAVGCDTDWHTIGDTDICQCKRQGCGVVINVRPATAPITVARGVAALQHTAGLPADDFPGCVD